MRLARLVVVPLLAFPSTAFAVDTVPLLAIVSSGLADGASMMVGAPPAGTVAMPEPGLFVLTLASGETKFLFDETDTCIVHLHVQMPGAAAELRYDLTKMTGISIDDRGKFEGLDAVVNTIEGPDVVQVLMGDKWVTQPGFAFLVGSLTVPDYQAAADELQRIC